MLQEHCRTSQTEMENLRRDANSLRLENSQLRAELSNLNGTAHQAAAPVNGVSHNSAPHMAHPAPSTPMESYQADPYGRNRVDPYAVRGAELPPLRSIGGAQMATPDSMSGVQYQNESPRGATYRGERY